MLREILKANKTGIADDLPTLLAGDCMNIDRTPKTKELTGAVPMRFNSDGTSLLDWSITGAAGGVGRPGKNYLRMMPVTVSDGLGSTISYKYFMGDYGENYSLAPGNHEVAPIGSNAKVKYQQWMIPSYGSEDIINGMHIVKDGRTEDYENCFWFADLKAGTYKLVCEYATVYRDNYHYRRYGYGYRMGYYYFINYGTQTNHPHVKLIAPDDTVVLSERLLTDGTETSTTDSKVEDYGYIPGTTTTTWFYHEEFTFTVPSDMRLGFFAVFPAKSRFMICDTDVVADKNVLDTTVKSCWEPYQITLPITVTGGGETTTVTIDLGSSPLYENDALTFTGTGITVPTYSGRNVIDVDSDVKPAEMYIKYKGW